jgi:hypothetical protein
MTHRAEGPGTGTTAEERVSLSAVSQFPILATLGHRCTRVYHSSPSESENS